MLLAARNFDSERHTINPIAHMQPVESQQAQLPVTKPQVDHDAASATLSQQVSALDLKPLDIAWEILFKQESWLDSSAFDDYMEQGMTKDDLQLLHDDELDSIVNSLKFFPGRRFASALSHLKEM